MSSLKPVGTLHVGAPVTHLAMSPSGEHIAYACAGGVYSQHAENPHCPPIRIMEPLRPIVQLAFGLRNTLYVADTKTVTRLRGHQRNWEMDLILDPAIAIPEGEIRQIAISPNEQRVAVLRRLPGEDEFERREQVVHDEIQVFNYGTRDFEPGSFRADFTFWHCNGELARIYEGKLYYRQNRPEVDLYPRDEPGCYCSSPNGRTLTYCTEWCTAVWDIQPSGQAVYLHTITHRHREIAPNNSAGAPQFGQIAFTRADHPRYCLQPYNNGTAMLVGYGGNFQTLELSPESCNDGPDRYLPIAISAANTLAVAAGTQIHLFDLSVL